MQTQPSDSKLELDYVNSRPAGFPHPLSALAYGDSERLQAINGACCIAGFCGKQQWRAI